VREAKLMANEIYDNVEVGEVEESGHYIAEENPSSFCQKILAFVTKAS
jgi:pimeloyl-ACP methyl ester carboxylesterase